MSRKALLAMSFLLMMGALPVISLGMSRSSASFAWAGALLLGIGGVVALVSRFLGR